ncbi:AAA family ATPase [Vreelandella rituensis]|uniref:ATP-binding protein n=1 Tax=Vreelandella rituensis TaxID=2282306 RepID=A0A368U9W5_9GAMM|nr:AAA family ATPase [Halomonas rituensis]RCV93744.1 ATP-binding protein [Halomonas rituensis]
MARRLILIGGMPGSGKTLIGKALAGRLGLFVDKDTVSQFFTEQMLQLLGSHVDDRESGVYLGKVRDIEYETMMKHALENLALGHTVICSAPFIREFGDPQWLDGIHFEAELLDADVIKIWIHVDPRTARERILSRGASRDVWKLINWDTYISTIPKTAPSNIGAVVIDNSCRPESPLFEQIEAVVARLQEPMHETSLSP